MAELINIHAVIPGSRVNGPGKRMVVFFQGCSRGCVGCFNPDTHTFEERSLYTASGIFESFAPSGIEGLTVSGGEPFMQVSGLLELLQESSKRGLSSMVYTGFTIEELLNRAEAKRCLEYIDVLIDGPYREEMAEHTLLARGSTNQRLHFLTERYALSDLYMPGKVEVTIGKDGVITETGFSRLGAGR